MALRTNRARFFLAPASPGCQASCSPPVQSIAGSRSRSSRSRHAGQESGAGSQRGDGYGTAGSCLAQAGFPERREHPVGIASLVQTVPGSNSNAPLNDSTCDAVITQCVHYMLVAPDELWLMALVPENSVCAGFANQLSQLRQRAALARPAAWNRLSPGTRPGPAGNDAATSGMRHRVPISPSSSGDQMNTGTTGPPRLAAAISAGLSARRRSLRNQTMARRDAPTDRSVGSDRQGLGALHPAVLDANHPVSLERETVIVGDHDKGRL